MSKKINKNIFVRRFTYYTIEMGFLFTEEDKYPYYIYSNTADKRLHTYPCLNDKKCITLTKLTENTGHRYLGTISLKLLGVLIVCYTVLPLITLYYLGEISVLRKCSQITQKFVKKK